MAVPKTTVLIAGGSIAGLTLANILERIGIDFLVLEKHHEIAPDVGASIAIFMNGFRIFDQLGLRDKIMELTEGEDAFKTTGTTDEHGKPISHIENASQKLIDRLGYAPIFVDRQMIIQALYDNLQNKSKILLNQGVSKVETFPGGVRVHTKSGKSYSGDILIGADGIHSTVRREMWRISDDEQPGYFPTNKRAEVPCDYCCMFGISKSSDTFPRYSSQHVQGVNHSYLIASGPKQRLYWFLFQKLPERSYGLYERVPRYTIEQEQRLAEEHASDPLAEGLTFGDVYEARRTATLQALPEFVASKWHYGRMITIGDAAHKFNPINGQGGNSAIEDAAVLSNHLHRLWISKSKKHGFTDEEITAVFEATQSKRYQRASNFMKAASRQQSLLAMDTLVSRVIAKYILPHMGPESIIEMLTEASRPGARLEMLAMPRREHSDFYDDELPAPSLESSLPGQIVAAVVFLCLTVFAAGKMRIDDIELPTSFLGHPPQTVFTGFGVVDEALKMFVLSFADLIGWADYSHTLQAAYILAFLVPVLVIWYVEGNRSGTKGSLISWPALFGIAMNVRGIGVIAPVYFLISIWTTSRSSYRSTAGRVVPVSKAQAILPAILLGYGLPTVLMFLPSFPMSQKQNLVAAWQFAVLPISLFLAGFSKAAEEPQTTNDKHQRDDALRSDVVHLENAYNGALAISAVIHVLFLLAISLTDLPGVSFARLLLPHINDAAGVTETDTFLSAVFTFLKFDFLFSATATILYGVYSIYELRRRGLVTTGKAFTTLGIFLAAQIPLGPGAAIMGLWRFRERVMAQKHIVAKIDEVAEEAKA